jgi:hypothetical protein
MGSKIAARYNVGIGAESKAWERAEALLLEAGLIEIEQVTK